MKPPLRKIRVQQSSRDCRPAEGIPERWRRRQTRGAWSLASVSHTEFLPLRLHKKTFLMIDINFTATLGLYYVCVSLSTDRLLPP